MNTREMEILKQYGELSEEEERVISSAWYLQNERRDRVARKEYSAKMISEGWEPLTEEIVKKAFNLQKKIKIVATRTSDWPPVKIEKTYKPFYSGEHIGLMKPRSRTRGYSINQFENAFCKLI